MPDFFKNKKVASAVVERVPCSFAKPNPDGSAGTHYSVVLLDHNHNVLYVGSECEHKHGEGIQAVHELGGGTCFAVTEAFRKILGRIKNAQGVLHTAGYVDNNLPPLMSSAVQYIWSHSAGLHNERAVLKEYTPDLRTRSLQQAVDRVAGNMLSLTPRRVQGKHPERVQNHIMDFETYARVFRVGYANFFGHDPRLPRAGIEDGREHAFLTLQPNMDYKYMDAPIFALRKHDGSWVVFEDEIKSWASSNHTVSDKVKKGPERCIFCNDSFERMYRHVQGAKHIDRVLEVVKLVCKATSKTGLRMLNNPRHRSMFLKPR